MDKTVLIEIFGYIGSALVVISMLMPSIIKLRVINTAGSIISAVYALICGALPLVIMNVCLIIINVYRLYKLLKTQQEYDLAVGDADDVFVRYFIDHYESDIKTYFPGFDKNDVSGKKAFMVCCEGNPSGLTIASEENGKLDMVLDYTTPIYRDCSVGQFLYSRLPEHQIQTISFVGQVTEAHEAYMKKMGFQMENGKYSRTLSS